MRTWLYAVAALLLFVGLATVLLLTTFPNAIIRYVVEPKLKQLVVDRLGQRYALEMKSMKLSSGKDSLLLIGVRIIDNGRTAKGSTDTLAKNFGGETPLDRLTTDTVMISGLEYWKLIFQRGLFASTISIRSPKIYLRPGTLPKFEENTKLLPGFMPAVSSKLVKIENAEVYLSEQRIPAALGPHPTSFPGGGVLVKKASMEFRDFFLDEPTFKEATSHFFCKGATFQAEDISQVDSLGVTDIHIERVNGYLIDSSMSVYSVESRRPIEEVQRVAIDSIAFRGLDWYAALSGHGLHGRQVAISRPQIYLQDVASMSAHPILHDDAGDLIPLPTMLPDVTVDQVEIANAEVSAVLPQSHRISTLKRIGMSLNKFRLDTTTPFTHISSFFSESAHYGMTGENVLSTAVGELRMGAVRGTERSVAVSDVRLKPIGIEIKLIRVRSTEIGGLDIWKLLMREGLVASTVIVKHPAIYLSDNVAPPITSLDSALALDPLAVIRGVKRYPLPELLPEARVGSVRIIDANVHGIHLFDDPKPYRANGDSIVGLQATLKKLRLNRNTWLSKRGMLFSDAASFSLGAMAQHTRGATYRFSEGGVKGDLRKRTLTISSLHMLPTISEDSFGTAFKFRTERVDLFAPKLEIVGVNYQKLLLGDGLFADSMMASDWRMHVYGDRRRPEKPRISVDRFPHELFQEIRMPVGVQRVVLHDGNIRFRESWPDTTTPGTLTFDHINARVGRISNDAKLADTTVTPIEGDMKIMDAGHIDFSVGYQLLNPQLAMDIRGTVGSMDAALFNDFLAQSEPFVLTGRVYSAEFQIALRDSMMTGTLAPQYDSLHVKFFRWDRFPPGFVSFFANALIMRSHNTIELDSPIKTATMRARLDPNVNIFWSVWKPIRDGIGDVMRIPDWVW